MSGFSTGLSEDTHDLGFQFREIEGKDGAPGMQDQIGGRGQQIDVAAEGFTHAALDAVALVCFAKDFADSKADARAARIGCGAGREEPAHEGGLVLARSGVGALEVGVTAQTERDEGLFVRGSLGWGGHGRSGVNGPKREAGSGLEGPAN
ncbi:MAG TPA: hypothetical protein VG267_01585 [Terracidiphilus sp.]|nr:hypothetical protein [Terracidiphilus sp.]